MIELHTWFVLSQIRHKAVTSDTKNPARDFHPMLQLYGVFLQNSQFNSLFVGTQTFFFTSMDMAGNWNTTLIFLPKKTNKFWAKQKSLNLFWAKKKEENESVWLRINYKTTSLRIRMYSSIIVKKNFILFKFQLFKLDVRIDRFWIKNFSSVDMFDGYLNRFWRGWCERWYYPSLSVLR